MTCYNTILGSIINQDIRKLLDTEKDSVTENMTKKKLIELYLEIEGKCLRSLCKCSIS